jgi:hypothetical protein
MYTAEEDAKQAARSSAMSHWDYLGLVKRDRDIEKLPCLRHQKDFCSHIRLESHKPIDYCLISTDLPGHQACRLICPQPALATWLPRNMLG